MNEAECRKILSMNIKKFRNRLGLSQFNLALNLGISPNFLSDIETGKKWVSPQTLALLAESLQVELHELFKQDKELDEDVKAIMSQCVEDISVAVRQSVTQSVEDSLKNIRKHYSQ
jgi:transcriptional regulator with XRE-family HTH domain